MSFCFFCGKTENDEEKLWHYKRCTWYNEHLRLKAFCLFPNRIYIYIFNSPFIELKFTKCQSIRLRCPVFVFFKKCVTFHCCIHLCIYPYTEIKLCVYRLYIEGLFIWNVCILKYMRTICCIYLKCKVQLFDNKRHTCYVEFRCGYFKWVETAKPLLKYSVLCI